MDINSDLEKIQSQKSHPTVFVSGMGGSGKTTFAKKLVAGYPNAIHFEADWYLKYSSMDRSRRIVMAMESGDQKLLDEELDPTNHYNWDAFKKDIEILQKNGKLTLKKVWDQKTGEKTAEYYLDFHDKPGLIVCDGDHIIHPDIVQLADFVILIDISYEEARKRAEARDIHRSSPEHLARKKFIAEHYDVPYFQTYRKNANIIVQA